MSRSGHRGVAVYGTRSKFLGFLYIANMTHITNIVHTFVHSTYIVHLVYLAVFVHLAIFVHLAVFVHYIYLITLMHCAKIKLSYTQKLIKN